MELLAQKHGSLKFIAYRKEGWPETGAGWVGWYEKASGHVVAYLDKAGSIWTWMQNGTLTTFKEGQRMVRLP